MKDLILLHGALGTKAQLTPLATLLSNQFKVHTLNFEGHGERISNKPFSIELFSRNLLRYISENNLDQPHVFGYSMGGYVALLTEVNHPGTLGKLITLGTKFNWTPESSAKEVRMLNPEAIEEKVPKFAAHLEKLHAPNDWKTNMSKTADMMLKMGNTPPLTDQIFAKIEMETFLHVGENDTMVSQDETAHVHAKLPNSHFTVIEDCEHPIERVNLEMISAKITEIL